MFLKATHLSQLSADLKLISDLSSSTKKIVAEKTLVIYSFEFDF